MADLLIKGMELPKSCMDCKLTDSENCTCVLKEFYNDEYYVGCFEKDRAPWCPLVEVPTHEPKRGKWIKNEGRYGWHCSVCGEYDLYAFAWNCDKGENELQDRYCPNCGARMDGEEDE